VFHLEATPDRPPTLFQLAPERSIKLPPEMAVQLDLDCLDDFGLTRLDLVYRRNDGDPQRLHVSKWEGTREAKVLYPWKLDDIATVPGDRIRYHLELTDNDAVTGPKTTIGPECEIRFPTLEEMYANLEDDRQDQVMSVKDVLDEQKQLSKDLRAIQNEIKQSKAMRWEQQEQLKDLAERQQKVSQQVDQMAQSLEHSLDQMQQANLFTPEMLSKVQQINQMVKDIQSPQFHQYLQKLQDAIRRLDRSAVNKALENMNVSQQELERNLDRTLQMLQQIKREEALDRLVEQAERMLEEQKRLNQELGDKPDSAGSSQDPSDQKQDDQKQGDLKQDDQPLSPQDAARLKEKQEALRQELAKLQKELEQLRQEAEQKWQALQKEMQERQSEQQLSTASEKMQDAAQSMGSCKKKDSLKFGREAEKKLDNFAKGMRQAQQSMQGADQEQVTRRLYLLAGQLVQLSKEQEAMLVEGPAKSTRELAEGEQRLTEGARKTLDQLFELARQSRFITPELGRVMGEAVSTLERSKKSFGDGDRASGMSAGQSGSQTLDQTVLALLNANQQMCNSSCSSGSPNPLARLRNLSGQQESLNQDTQSMLGQGQDGNRLSSSGGQGERLAQMAARQQMIRQGLEEVQQTAGSRSDILGRLDDLGKEMDEVAQQMRSRDVDERILQRQQRILSRLLTAQRSLRKEGEKEERISRPGINPPERVSPPPVASGPSAEEGLRRGILRGSQDPVPGEFRRLVDSYFRSLGKQP
jgi:hypothetical protein